MLRVAGRDNDSALARLDRADAVLVHRQQQPGVELEHVVRDPRRDVCDPAETPPALLDDLEADELEDVVLVLLRRWQRRPRDLEERTACDGPLEPDHGPAAGALRLDDPQRLAADDELCADREPPGILARVLPRLVRGVGGRGRRTVR